MSIIRAVVRFKKSAEVHIVEIHYRTKSPVVDPAKQVHRALVDMVHDWREKAGEETARRIPAYVIESLEVIEGSRTPYSG